DDVQARIEEREIALRAVARYLFGHEYRPAEQVARHLLLSTTHGVHPHDTAGAVLQLDEIDQAVRMDDPNGPLQRGRQDLGDQTGHIGIADLARNGSANRQQCGRPEHAEWLADAVAL